MVVSCPILGGRNSIYVSIILSTNSSPMLPRWYCAWGRKRLLWNSEDILKQNVWCNLRLRAKLGESQCHCKTEPDRVIIWYMSHKAFWRNTAQCASSSFQDPETLVRPRGLVMLVILASCLFSSRSCEAKWKSKQSSGMSQINDP